MKLDSRIKALIAVGASITANCQPCLQATLSMALESGAGEQEIAEAIEIGRKVRKSASSKTDKFAASLNFPPRVVAESAADEGCGCG